MTTASTHVLDAARGLPAAGLAVTLTGPVTRHATTDADGRIAWGELPGPGAYVLELATGDWFASQDRETFYPRIVLEVALGAPHTHVAVLLSPFAYTTYRGS
ncbi:hydroxyisourate hydrolase [Myceligenerans indicum]|uniref:Hydroxyisourate hydrolase n=1 Tax=Myceligenerans indicum TaxID=2593663 RepID=A0ABS1LQR8_9MICO|nr:hydroxyisourate hydrolase [Myceligenerans indicum]MBL0888373.1 hydroxyisourate hydrolase [Myceligenerans indicum]